MSGLKRYPAWRTLRAAGLRLMGVPTTKRGRPPILFPPQAPA